MKPRRPVDHKDGSRKDSGRKESGRQQREKPFSKDGRKKDFRPGASKPAENWRSEKPEKPAKKDGWKKDFRPGASKPAESWRSEKPEKLAKKDGWKKDFRPGTSKPAENWRSERPEKLAKKDGWKKDFLPGAAKPAESWRSEKSVKPAQKDGWNKDSRPAPATPAESWKADQPVLVWGVHVVEALLAKRPEGIERIYCDIDAQGERLDAIRKRAAACGIRLADLDQLGEEALADAVHQGVAARVTLPEMLAFEDLLTRIETIESSPIILALDSLQDPQNLGAIVRSAVAAGVTAILLPKDRSARITGTVFKVSAGALALAEICQVTNLAQSLKELQGKGVWVYGTAADAPSSIYQTDWRGPICLVVGNENKGMRELIRRTCDGLVSIPMAGGFDSLNASVAVGVVLFEMVRQRIQID